MGFRFRKSVKIAPGVRLNIGKKSTSVSIGGKGARFTTSTSGRKTTSLGIPGTGISYVSTSGGKRKTSAKKQTDTGVQKNTPPANYSPRTYKMSGTLAIIVAVLALLVGLLLFPSGGWVLCIFGLYLLFTGIHGIKKSKQPTETEKPRATVKNYNVAEVEQYLDNIKHFQVENEAYTYDAHKLINTGYEDDLVYQYEYKNGDVELAPEPENPHNPNAIKVMVAGLQVGYIKKGSCSHILKAIREDRIKKIECSIGGGSYVYVDVDYDTDDIGRKKTIYTLERGDHVVWVNLHITEE